MIRFVRRTILATAFAASVSLSGLASAATINSPFPRANVWVGLVAGDGNVWACFSNKADKTQFRWFFLGGSAGLSENFAIHGGDGTGQGDWITVVETVAPTGHHLISLCGGTWTLHAPNYNGFFLDVYGGVGRDRLWSGTGDSWLFGEGDGDDLRSKCTDCQVSGASGGDLIRTMSTTSNSESIFGDSSADCFYDETTGWSVLNGGTGGDVYEISGLTVPAGTTSVENTPATLGRTRCFSPFSDGAVLP